MILQLIVELAARLVVLPAQRSQHLQSRPPQSTGPHLQPPVLPLAMTADVVLNLTTPCVTPRALMVVVARELDPNQTFKLS